MAEFHNFAPPRNDRFPWSGIHWEELYMNLKTDKAMLRLRRMSRGGEEMHKAHLTTRLAETIITESMKVTNEIGMLKRDWKGNKTPAKSLPNEAICATEELGGTLGVGGNHERNLVFKDDVIWYAGIHHQRPGFTSLNINSTVAEINSQRKYIKDTQQFIDGSVSDSFTLQPAITSLVDKAIENFQHTQYPDISIGSNGTRSMELGKVKEYDPKSQAIRIVFKVGTDFRFANIDINTWNKLKTGTLDPDQPFFLSKLLTEGIEASDLDRLEQMGINSKVFGRWFDEPPAIVSISAMENSDPFLHLLDKRRITDPRIAVNLLLKYETKDFTLEKRGDKDGKLVKVISKQKILKRVNNQFGHLQATALPARQYLKEALQTVAFIENGHKKSVQHRNGQKLIIHEPFIIPIKDEYLARKSPQAAGDQANLNLESFAHRGTRRIARELNIMEIRTGYKLPQEYVKMASLNKKMHKFLADSGDPNITPENIPGTTDPLTQALALDGSAYLAVLPKDSEELTNALAIAVFGNGINAELEKIINKVIVDIKENDQNAIDIAKFLEAVDKNNPESLISKYFKFAKIFEEEKQAALHGESTAGTLALATYLGKAREFLEEISAKSLGRLMKQLQAEKMNSSTGSEDPFFDPESPDGICEFTDFWSANSKTAIFSNACSGDEVNIRHRPDSPRTIAKLVAEFKNADFYRAIRDQILGADWHIKDRTKLIRSLSNMQRTVVLWLSSKIKEAEYQSYKGTEGLKHKLELQLREDELLREVMETEGSATSILTIEEKHKQAEQELAAGRFERIHYASTLTDIPGMGQIFHYKNLNEFIEAARVDADIYNRLEEFSDIVTDALAEYLKNNKELGQSNEYTIPLRQLYGLWVQHDQIEDLTHAMSLAYSLNKYYLAKSVEEIFRQHQEGSNIQPIQTTEEMTLVIYSQNQSLDFHNFEDIKKLCEHAYSRKISTHDVINYISEWTDFNPISVLTWLKDQIDPNPEIGMLSRLVKEMQDINSQNGKPNGNS